MIFLHTNMSTIGIYPEYLVPENLFFQWTVRTKMHHINQRIFKEVNGYHKYLRCPNLWDKNFEVLLKYISLDRLDLMCSETVKTKPTVNYAGVITYSKKIIFMVCGYITVVIL